MIDALRRYLTVLKVVAYTGLAFMIYWNLIGPEGVAEIFKIDNPSEEGLKVVGLKIPEYVLYWTFGTVILEIVDNFFSLFKFTKFEDKPITREEFRDEITDRNLGRFETNMRVAKIEGELKKLK